MILPEYFLMSPLHSYYDILGLPLNSSPEAIKQAYRNLVKLWHPDRFHHNPQQQKQAEVTFKKINDSIFTKKTAENKFDRNINLWNIETGENIATLAGHLDRVSGVMFNSDETQLISASWDKTIKLWKLDTQTEICTIKEHSDAVTAIAISADGKTIISGSADRSVKILQFI